LRIKVNEKEEQFDDDSTLDGMSPLALEIFSYRLELGD